MPVKHIIVTEDGLKKLRDEFNYLTTVRRKEVIEAIKVARSFGDLTENSEYDEAKSEQAKVEAKIAELEEKLKHVRVIDESELSGDAAHVGSRVKVLIYPMDEDDDEEEIEYSIVGSTESDPLNRRISDQSPIGRALIGRKVGDETIAYTPAGELTMKILEIDN